MSDDDEFDLLGEDAVEKSLKQFLALYGAPAFMRRAQRVHETRARLMKTCRAKKDEWLNIVRVRLGMLRALAGDWQRIEAYVKNTDELARLHDELRPKDYFWVKATSSDRALRRAINELDESIDFFNRRWLTFINDVDLAAVNEERDKYNRYYLLEKECLVRSPRVARQGFTPLPPITHEMLLEMLPPLPEVQFAD